MNSVTSTSVENEVKENLDNTQIADSISHKESPLTDYGTSPPNFDLQLPDFTLDGTDEVPANLERNIDDSDSLRGNDLHSSANDEKNADKHVNHDVQASFDFSSPNKEEVKEKVKSSDELAPNLVSHTDALHRRDSYESSELSDLGDDQSEAETDKMDFLDDRDVEGLPQLTDLQALAQLTKEAELELDLVNENKDDEKNEANAQEERQEQDEEKEQDEDKEEEEEEEAKIDEKDKEDQIKVENAPYTEAFNGSKLESETVTKKRSLTEEDEEDEGNTGIKNDTPSNKKAKILAKNENYEVDNLRQSEVNTGNDRNGQESSSSSKELLILDEDNEAEDEEDEDEDNRGQKDQLVEVIKLEDDDESAKTEKAEEVEDVKEVEKAEEAEEAVEAEKAEKTKEVEAEEAEEVEEEAGEVEDDDEDEEEEDDDDDEEEKDLGVANTESREDEEELRLAAIKELTSIEAYFAEVRDQLYESKLKILETELDLCIQGLHPQLEKIYQRVNEIHQDSVALIDCNLKYKLRCIDRETKATRTSIHQDFLKNLMNVNQGLITKTTTKWYRINKERNQLDQLVENYNFSAIPEKSTGMLPLEVSSAMDNGTPKLKKTLKQNIIVELVQQRNNLNEQLGILNGLVEFYGFPSAINLSMENTDEQASKELLLRKASPEEINEDLKAMGILT